MSEWISVEVRLPAKSMPVRVVAHDRISEFEDEIFAYVCPEHGNVIWEMDNEDYEYIVLHWMPLPEPPAMNQEGR